MTHAQDNADTTASAIDADFDGRRRAWLSDTGRWRAARTDPITAAELTAGCLPFLSSQHPDELTRLIHAQEHLRASAAPRPAVTSKPGPQPASSDEEG